MAVPESPNILIQSSEDLKSFITDALDAVTGPSAFAYGDNKPNFPNPGLSVDGHGAVGLPLSAGDAKAIAAKSQKSAFGHGTETRVDDSVRRSWELNPDQFALRNPQWDRAISGILPQVRKELALSCSVENVKAELYKLLLYEEGAFFKPHQDSEKTPGMFGTLIVALPSPHQGGGLLLKHQKEQFKFETADTSDFEFSWAAWYSDVFHEVLPVTQGWRLVLTYNLVIKSDQGTNVSVPPALSNFKTRIRMLLHAWEADSDSDRQRLPAYLVHRLEHQYTEASLSFHNLKARDYAQVQCLRDVAAEVGITLFLASMEREVTADDEEDGEEIDSDICLKYLADLDGTKIGESFELERTNILQDEELDHAEPDDEDHSGYTGNEGCTATFWYRDTVLVMVPSAEILDFTLRGEHKHRTAHQQLQQLMASPSKDERKHKQLAQLCEWILEQRQPRTVSYLYAMSSMYPPCQNTQAEVEAQKSAGKEIALMALDRSQLDLYDKTFAVLQQDLPLECFNKLGRMMSLYTEETMKPRITTALMTLPWVSLRHEALQQVVAGFDSTASSLPQQTQDGYREWFESTLVDLVVFECGKLRKVDGAALAARYVDFADPVRRARVENRVKSAPTPVGARFCVRLGRLLRTSTLSASERETSLTTNLASLWTAFRLNNAEALAHLPQNSRDPEEVTSSILTAKELVDLLTLTEQYVGKPTLRKEYVCSKLQAACNAAAVDELQSTLLPFAERVVSNDLPFLQEQDGSPTAASIQLVRTLVQRYALTYVGKEPPPPSDWSLPSDRTSCRCGDCSDVKEFLASPTRKVGEFQMNQKRRDHLDRSFKYDRTASYTLATLRTTATHTWQITKNRKEYDTGLWDRQGRVQEGKRTLQDMDGKENRLKNFLGDMYTAAMDMKVERMIAMPLQGNRQPLQNVEANRGNKRPQSFDTTASPSKRRVTGGATVVDLTGD